MNNSLDARYTPLKAATVSKNQDVDMKDFEAPSLTKGQNAKRTISRRTPGPPH